MDTATNDQVLACIEPGFKVSLVEVDVSGLETEMAPTCGKFAAELMYGKAAMLADEALRSGYRDLARSIEASNSDFLKSMPRDQQKRALAISYEMTMAQAGAEPAPPRIRLAYSRD